MRDRLAENAVMAPEVCCCVASTIFELSSNEIVEGRYFVATEKNALLLSSNSCRFPAAPWVALYSSLTIVWSEPMGTDANSLSLLSSRSCTGGGSCVSLVWICDPSPRYGPL